MSMFNNKEKINNRKNDGAHDVAFHEAEKLVSAHFDGLHDQNEDEAGNLINPLTGKNYDNSTEGNGMVNLGKISKLPKQLEKSAEELVEEYYKKNPHLRPKD